MAVTRLNFTAKDLNALAFASGKTAKYKDDGGPQSERTLYLYVGAKVKTLYFIRKVLSKVITYKIGRFPAISLEQARKRCKELCAETDSGHDPQQQKREARQQGLTFSEVFEQYVADAKSRIEKPLKPTTEAQYRRSINAHFKHWLHKEAESITFDDIESWYKTAATKSSSSANTAARIGRAIYNYQLTISQRQRSSNFQFNPFVGHKLKKEKVRQDCIEPEELKNWFLAVHQLTNSTTRDYFITLLFTGLRRREAAQLTWLDVDLRKHTATAKNTKNGTDHVIPLPANLVELFTLRKKQAADPKGYVFESTGKEGYLSEPKKAVLSIAEKTGIHASPHALRRTYSNIAAFEAGIHDLARKRLLNHSVSSDVTAKHYSVLRMPRLKRYQQDIADTILDLAEQDKPSADIVKLEAV